MNNLRQTYDKTCDILMTFSALLEKHVPTKITITEGNASKT